MIDLILKLLVFLLVFSGYLIFLFVYRVFNGTSTRKILFSNFEDKDNGNLNSEVIFSQSIIRLFVGFWGLGLIIHTIFTIHSYLEEIPLSTWWGSGVYFCLSIIPPLFGYIAVYLLKDKAIERLISIPKGILLMSISLSKLNIIKKLVTVPNGSNNEEKEVADIDALEAVGLSVDPEEMKMIQGILRMDTVKVREIMRPRVDMVTVEANNDLNHVTNLMIEDGYSKIPVIGEGIDDVLGIAYARDVLKAVGQERSFDSIKDIVRPAIFVPESQNLEQLLHEFQKHRTRMAIVIDEHGGISGLVTVTDLIEEIVGELVDEFDIQDPDIRKINDSVFIVDAKMTIADLNEEIGTSLLVDGFDTIGGLIYQELGKMPVVGDHVEVNSLKITVQSTMGRRIGKLRLSIPSN